MNDQEGFFAQRGEDEIDLDLELELDFDELHNLVNEIKPGQSKANNKDGSAHYDVVATAFDFIVNPTTNQSIHAQPAGPRSGHNEDGDGVDVYANERDVSDCGTSQQHDHALDSTFHSNGHQNYADDDGASYDNNGQDLDQRRFNECSLDNMSLLLDNILATNKSVMNTSVNLAPMSLQPAHSTFINTCVESVPTCSEFIQQEVQSLAGQPVETMTCGPSSS